VLPAHAATGSFRSTGGLRKAKQELRYFVRGRFVSDLIMTKTATSLSEKKLNNFPGDPNKLLDAIIERLHLKNDAALSRVLEVAPPVISKLRHGALPIGPTILIRMHEVSEMGIREMRALMETNDHPATH
jgi:hypothetical protein